MQVVELNPETAVTLPYRANTVKISRIVGAGRPGWLRRTGAWACRRLGVLGTSAAGTWYRYLGVPEPRPPVSGAPTGRVARGRDGCCRLSTGCGARWRSPGKGGSARR